MRIINFILAVALLIASIPAMSDSKACAGAVRSTGDKALAGEYRKYRDSCGAYQGCVDKVLKADNVYNACRSKCGSTSGSQQKSCLKTCLSKTSSKTNETSKRVRESCGSLKSKSTCGAAQSAFQAILKSKGKHGKNVNAACAIMFGTV